ncbi:TetR/AcrR family transcriptional regulator [Nocardia vinacea]|uniref:TetR/AcrR family transcriptional regulator n=1 Tax=Nocardia vinacea TaxID=96468 RepID=UPI002E15F5FF|nr:TetR/AcrR family transcriptional regulator [Nocardia vinacea]
MSRWEPDARGRLEKSALELYRENGFESTTVAEITQRAGLTERTFFRHFADKREVLFAGASALQEALVRGVHDAPAAMPPLEAIATALTEVADTVFDQRREFAWQRQAVIAANAELRERELVKLATLAAALAEALRGRGVTDPAASLAAEAGIAVFKIAFESWVDGERTLSQLIRESVNELKLVTGAQDLPDVVPG